MIIKSYELDFFFYSWFGNWKKKKRNGVKYLKMLYLLCKVPHYGKECPEFLLVLLKFKLISFVCVCVCAPDVWVQVCRHHVTHVVVGGQFLRVKFSPSTVGSRAKLRSLSLYDNRFRLLSWLACPGMTPEKNLMFYQSYKPLVWKAS